MNKNYIFGIGILLAVLLAFTAPATARTDNVTFYLNASDGSHEVSVIPGEETTIYLDVYAPVNKTGGFEVAVMFDPDVLECLDITENESVTNWMLWTFRGVWDNAVDPDLHYMNFDALDFGGQGPGLLRCGDMRVRGVYPGVTTLYLGVWPDDVLDGNNRSSTADTHGDPKDWDDMVELTFTCTGSTYTVSGYTDPAATRVNITNLDKSGVVDERPADYIDPATGFYNLTLNVTDEVEAGNVLRITACDVTSDYESNCNVSTHEVVNAPGEDDNVNLTLNHYCLNFYPSFPFTTWEQEDWSGPTVMEMLIDHYLDPPAVPNQTVLNETGIGNNQGCNADLPYLDPRGMRYTLNEYLYYPYSPYIAHYGIGSYAAVEGALHYICYWQHLGPGAAPTYGDYSNWMAIRGIHTSENPYPQSAGDYDIYGFWVNDPNPTGIGENTYKSVDQWTGTYFKSLTGVRDGDIYKNMYVAVCEPPVQPDVGVRLVHSKARFSGVITADASDEELAVDVNGIPLNQVICNRKLDREKANKVVQAAIDSVNEGLIPYDPDFAEAFDGTVADKPMPVKSDTGEYYLVPFGIESDGMSVTAVVVVDSDGGKFKEASWVKEPAKYMPVTAQDALKILYKEMKGKSTVKVLEKDKVTGKFKKIDLEDTGVDTVGVTYNEVEKQSRKAYLELVCRGGSPYYPDWKITIGDDIYFVNQDGTVSS